MRTAVLLIISLAFSLVVALAADKPKKSEVTNYIRVAADPVDKNRKIDYATQCVVAIDKDSPARKLKSARGEATGKLRSGTAMVVDRDTGVSEWVLACGNDDLTGDGWVPSGNKICGAQAEAMRVLDGERSPVIVNIVNVPAVPVNVTVNSPTAVAATAPTLTIKPAEGRVDVGKAASFTATYDSDGAGPAEAADLSAEAFWASSNETVAAPGAKGVFIGKEAGEVTIRAVANGLTAEAKLIVGAGGAATAKSVAKKSGGERNWWDRNWKWVVPVAVAGGVVGGLYGGGVFGGGKGGSTSSKPGRLCPAPVCPIGQPGCTIPCP